MQFFGISPKNLGVGATSYQQKESSGSQETAFEFEKMSKFKNGKNWKILQVGTKNLDAPEFGKGKLEHPEVMARG